MNIFSRFILAGALLVSVGTYSASAQLIQAGIKGGVNFASIGGGDEDELYGNADQQTLTGWSFGGFLTLKPLPVFGVNADVLLNRVGTRAEEAGTELNIGLTYLEIPVTAQFYLPLPGPVKPRLYAGPSIGFGIGGKEEISGGGESLEQDVAFGDDQSDDSELSVYQSPHISGVVGAGLDVKLPVGPSLKFDVRYSFGISNIIPGFDDLNLDAPELRQNYLAFQVGIGFGG